MNQHTMKEISEAYRAHYHQWKAFLNGLSEEITELLEPNNLRFSVKGRVKALESLSEKISFLGRENPDEAPCIKDLIGLRVVVPFQEGVEQVVELLRQHFPVEEVERKSDKLSYREFAYDSVHVEIPIDPTLKLPNLCRPVVEVQVRTILQDAWAEVEHELIYKNHFRYPNNEAIRKKLAALNASLTLSDMIFQEIRDSQKQMEKWGHERFQALIDKADEFDGPTLPEVLVVEPDEQVEKPALAGNNRSEIERLLMAALQAHNNHDYKQAIEYYSQVLERNPELPIRSMVFSHRGMANFMLQRESQALSDFDRSYYCDKTNYRALNYRALVLRRMGYVEQALECLSQSLTINPNQADVYFLRAQTLVEINEEAQALEALTQALALDPSHEEADKLLDRLNSRRREPAQNGREDEPPKAVVTPIEPMLAAQAARRMEG